MALLHGLVARADVVVFPVNCVSHAAVHVIKKLCQQTGKTLIPLRGSGIGSLLTSLRIDQHSAAASSAAPCPVSAAS